MIGGTSWVSTQEYYYRINKVTNERAGGTVAANCIIRSFNFDEILRLQQKNDDEAIYNMILTASLMAETAGASCIVLCANTMHKYAQRLMSDINIPIIHIAEATANEIERKGLSKVGLLGTKITMEMDFYHSILKKHNIASVVPEKTDREKINSYIFDELTKDVFNASTKTYFVDVINKLYAEGCEGIILGCTEIPLLVNQQDVSVPLFNTLEIHAKAAVDFIFSEKED